MLKTAWLIIRTPTFSLLKQINISSNVSYRPPWGVIILVMNSTTCEVTPLDADTLWKAFPAPRVTHQICFCCAKSVAVLTELMQRVPPGRHLNRGGSHLSGSRLLKRKAESWKSIPCNINRTGNNVGMVTACEPLIFGSSKPFFHWMTQCQWIMWKGLSNILTARLLY